MGLLKGIRVIDTTRLLPGGFCTMILTELGAEVIKVEQPVTGDYIRLTPPTDDGVSPVHNLVNRGKLSIAIDLKKREGKEILYKLISSSDVFVEGYRPGVMDRLGFSFKSVSKLNERIVYCSITSFGSWSGLSKYPSHDLNIQAISGTLAYSRKNELPLIQLADLCSGLYASLGIVSALIKRDRAVFVDVSMFQSIFSFMLLGISFYLVKHKSPKPREGALFGSEPWYNLYRTRDGKYLAVAAVEENFWLNLLNELGLAHLARGGSKYKKKIFSSMKKRFIEKNRDDWISLLMEKETCVTPVLDLAELIESDWGKLLKPINVKGSDIFIEPPFRFSHSYIRVRGRAPRLGEHTDQIMRSLGYSIREIEMLRKSMVIQ